MQPRHLEIAAELCERVGAEDLLAYLDLSPQAGPEEVRAALKKKRMFFQSMQGNPKYRDAARLFITHRRVLEDLLADPAAYAAQVRAARSHARLPMLEMVIDSVLADGVLTLEEDAFVRESAVQLGISVQVYEEVLRRRCQAAGVAMPAPAPPPAPVAGPSVSPTAAPSSVTRRPKGFAGAGWWDESFATMLQSAIPADTRRLVDLATGVGWGALTLLPDRPELEYLGIDQDTERLRIAERAVRNSPVGARVALLPGEPEKLPVPDAAVDVVLCVRALHRHASPRAVLNEAARVLRPGGRIVCVEPDTDGVQVWFDGRLTEVEAALRALAARVDVAVGGHLPPSDRPGLSLGPRLAGLMAGAALAPAVVHLHPVQEARLEDMESFAARLAARVEKLALVGNLRDGAPEVAAAMVAIDRAEARIGSATTGLAATLLPLFLVVGVRGGEAA